MNETTKNNDTTSILNNSILKHFFYSQFQQQQQSSPPPVHQQQYHHHYHQHKPLSYIQIIEICSLCLILVEHTIIFILTFRKKKPKKRLFDTKVGKLFLTKTNSHSPFYPSLPFS